MSEGGDEDTTIPVTKATRKRLKLWKTKLELTYDDAINHLLDEHDGDENE